MRPLSDEGDFQRGSINRHKNTPTGTLPWVHPPSHLDLLGTPSTTRDIFLKLQFSAHDGPFFLLSRVEMDWGSPIEGVSEGCDNHPKHVNFSKNVENCHRTHRYRLGARMTFTGVCQLFYVMLKWLDYKVSCNQMEVTRDEWIAFHSDLIVSVWIEFIDPVCSNRFSEAHEEGDRGEIGQIHSWMTVFVGNLSWSFSNILPPSVEMCRETECRVRLARKYDITLLEIEHLMKSFWPVKSFSGDRRDLLLSIHVSLTHDRFTASRWHGNPETILRIYIFSFHFLRLRLSCGFSIY